MEQKMKVAVMTAIGRVELQQRDIPVPAPGEVLVRLEYVGVCGSDLHFFEDGRIGKDVVAKPPFVLGHEPAGTVVTVGTGVTGLAAGDRVALEPGKTCGCCEFCRSGRYNLCPDVEFYAAPPVDGVFCEYTAHPAALCFKLPDSVSTLEGALIEPLAVGFHAANQAEIKPGHTVVVTGTGCIGLVSVMAAKAKGAKKIIAVDVMQSRLEKALSIGADSCINSAAVNCTDEIMQLTDNHGADVVIDTSGNETVVADAVRYVKKGANIVLVGYSASGDMTLPTSLFTDKELSLKSVFRYRHIYPMAVEAVANGLPLKEIVSSIYPLEDIQKALDAAVADKEHIVKAVIKTG